MSAASRILVLAAALGAPLAVRAAGPLHVNGAGVPLSFAVDPVPFNPDRGALGMLSNAAAVASVAANFAVWAAVSTSSITFVNAGALPVDVTVFNWPSYLGVCDGLNAIIFDTDGSITDDALGPGASDSVLGFAGPECATDVPPVIAESVAVLNGKWIDGVGPTEAPLVDFNAVFIHEFGHYINLDHSQVNLVEAFDGNPANDDAIATMFPFLVDGAESSTLNLDDEVAVSMLYPDASFTSARGAITGTIYRPDGTTPFQGAYVIARQIGNPRLAAVGAASGTLYRPWNPGGPPAPSLEGLYEIPGLPPGSYTIEIEDVHPSFTGGSGVGPFDPPTSIPGPPEFYNGASEAGANPPDDPADATPVAAVAGSSTSGIDVVINAPPAATNDDCAAPAVVPGLPYSDLVDTSGATTDPSDPIHSCTGSQDSKSVWYSFTAASDVVVIADTFGSSYDTVLSVHSGACGALGQIACNDNFSGMHSRVVFSLLAGQTALIEVTAYDGEPGGVLKLHLTELPRYAGAVADPTGDTYGVGGFVPDISSLSACSGYGEVRIGLAFSAPIAPGTAGAPNSIGGFVDLDTDQNRATGIRPRTEVFSPYLTGLGTDYYVTLLSTTATTANVIKAGFGFAGSAAASFGPTSLTIAIPLSLLGGDDGNLGAAAVAGNLSSPTDAVPNRGHVYTVACAPGCSLLPLPGCRQPVLPKKSSVKLKKNVLPAKDQLGWKWAGAATAKGDFGNPTLGTSYRLCVYDQVAGAPVLKLSASVPAGGICGAKPCWVEKKTGYAYADKTLANAGIQKIDLKAGADGKAKMGVKGKGANLAMPGLSFAQDPGVVVQLVKGDGSLCWDAQYGAPASKNDPVQFADKSD